MRPTYPIATDRLLMRPYRDSDYDILYDMFARPEVVRYLYEEPRSPESVRELLNNALDNVALEKENDYLSLILTTKEDPDVAVGNVMLHWLSEVHQSGEVGYTIHPDHAGKGYATEATRAMVDLGFRDTKMHRIIGRLDARNIASQRVLEKSGMRTEAHLVENEWVKGEWASEIVCAILRAEWEQTQLLD